MMKKIQSQQSSSSSGATTGKQPSSSIILPSIHEIQSLRVSPLASGAGTGEELKSQHQTSPPSSHLSVTTKNNYSQYSLSNKIIMSVVQCLQTICELNFDWKDFQTGKDERKEAYRYLYQLVASNPMTELASVCVLLILPLLSQSQVSDPFLIQRSH
jgi:hypothetical protein